MLEALLLWPLLAIVAGAVALSKGRSFIGYFLLGLLLPIIGVLLAIGLSDRRTLDRAPAGDRRPRRKCPECAEMVLVEANVCAHCKAKLTPKRVSVVRSMLWGPAPPRR